MDNRDSLKSWRLFIACALILGLAAWLPALVAWFTAEDLTQLYNVRDSPWGIWSGKDGPGFFRPVVAITLWAGEQIWGTNPRPFHILNVLLHLANSVMVAWVLRAWCRVLPDGHLLRQWTGPVMAGTLFWLWPGHAEPVSWILGLTDVGATFPALISLGLYLGWRNGRPSWWALGAGLAFAVALASKESVAALPGAVAVYETTRWRITRHGGQKGLLGVGYLVLLVVLYLGVRFGLTGAVIGGYSTAVHTNFRPANLWMSVGPNLSNAFLPLPGVPLEYKYLMLGALLVGVATVLFVRKRSLPAHSRMVTALLAAAGVITFAPGINLPAGIVMEGQRFAYFPSVFAVMSVATCAVLLMRSRKAVMMVGILGCSVCTALLLMLNVPRYEAGKVTRQIVRGMKKLPAARRIFVLTTPGTYKEAFVMPHGYLQAGRMMVPGFALEAMPNQSQLINWAPDTKVLAERTGANEFRVSIVEPGTGRVKPWLLPMANARKIGNDLAVTLPDYDPAYDKVAYVDGGNWVLVD